MRGPIGEGTLETSYTDGLAYEPLASQGRFHQSTARFRCFLGPVGTGKTAALCHEAVQLALVNKGRTGLIGAPTYPMLRDVALPTVIEVLEKRGVNYDHNKSAFTIRLAGGGSTIAFRTLDQPERLRGTNLAWFGIDEVTYTKEEAWLRLEARLRDPKATALAGIAAGTPKGFDWVYHRFRNQPVEGYELVEAKPFENEHLLEQTPDYYERLKNSYDEHFYQQEVLGQFVNLGAGRVYHAFDRNEHVGEFQMRDGEPLLWSWDFNINPMASVICQRAGPLLYVLDEIVLRTSSTPEVCEEFLRRYGKHRGGLRIYGDATGGRRSSASTDSDHELIRAFLSRNRDLHGELVVGRSNPLVRDRINTMNGQLMNAQGERRLFVSERCRELIQDLEQVSYKPNSGQIDKDRDSDRTHVSDALGYLVWEEFRLARKVGEKNGRLV